MPLAREDGEYPDWLWGLLEGGKFGAGGTGPAASTSRGDLFCMLPPSLFYHYDSLPCRLWEGESESESQSGLADVHGCV